MINIESFTDGYVVLGDSSKAETVDACLELCNTVPLIVSDPPYGNIVNESWDKVKQDDKQFASWMCEWTKLWSDRCLTDGGAFYTWGGVGKPGFRPFLRYLHDVEELGKFELANLVTWSKKRAYGVQNNYLWTREELAYFVKGNAKKPRTFNVPLLETKRGYDGYNKRYPAKSEFYRRTNVWTDINEMFRGKTHPTQKTQKLHEVIISVHTIPGEFVVDPFAGAGTTAMAARSLGRKFLVVENDETSFKKIIAKLRE